MRVGETPEMLRFQRGATLARNVHENVHRNVGAIDDGGIPPSRLIDMLSQGHNTQGNLVQPGVGLATWARDAIAPPAYSLDGLNEPDGHNDVFHGSLSGRTANWLARNRLGRFMTQHAVDELCALSNDPACGIKSGEASVNENFEHRAHAAKFMAPLAPGSSPLGQHPNPVPNPFSMAARTNKVSAALARVPAGRGNLLQRNAGASSSGKEEESKSGANMQSIATSAAIIAAVFAIAAIVGVIAYAVRASKAQTGFVSPFANAGKRPAQFSGFARPGGAPKKSEWEFVTSFAS